MTITEHLDFSVLTAPIATLDRRTLSQAWYSALYGDRSPSNEAGAGQTPRSGVSSRERASRSAQPYSQAMHETSKATAALRAAAGPQRLRGVEMERRAPRSPLARKIERAFLHPKAPARKASFSLDGEHGRVQVMLRSEGSRVKLVAICAPKAKARVAHALAQARYALALRGIDLDAQIGEKAAC